MQERFGRKWTQAQENWQWATNGYKPQREQGNCSGRLHLAMSSVDVFTGNP